MNRLFSSIVVVFCSAAIAARAADPGEEVIVVYNLRMPDSKSVATYYAQQRHVPADQVFGFELPTGENMTRAEFRDTLQRPLAAALEKRKLWHIESRFVPATTNLARRTESKVARSKIRYAVLAYGVPLRILSEPNLREAGTEALKPELQRNEAAVDSELALLPLVEQKLPLAGPLRNPVYTATNLGWFHPTNGVLMVARLDGPSPAIARGLVDKAMKAEEEGLWGRAYFDLRQTTDPAYKAGDEMIRNASEICRRLGFDTVVDENSGTFPASFPMSQIAFYVGWYTEHVSGPFALPVVEFMPGAFAYHLHSSSANSLRVTDRHWVGPFLAKGVTATMGTIDEPYLAGTPDMAVFTSRFLLGGFTFGEAAYASQRVLSWQTTVVGDPLYRPTAKNPDRLGKELEQNNNKLVEWCYVRLLNLNQVNGRRTADLVAMLEQTPATTNSAVLSEKLGDLYSAQGKPSSAIHECKQALKLGPSPQQRLRLRLTLGDRLMTQGLDAEAYENYKELLAEAPEYPDKSAILKKLVPLAQKLNKTADVERYEGELKR